MYVKQGLLSRLSDVKDAKSREEVDIQAILEKAFVFLSNNHSNGHFATSFSKTKDFRPPICDAPEELFSTVMVADALLRDLPNNHKLRAPILAYIKSQMQQETCLFNFGPGFPEYPPDSDGTALAHSTLLDIEGGEDIQKKAAKALRTILDHTSADGVIQTWLLNQRHNFEFDPVVGANVAYLAESLKQGTLLEPTLDQIIRSLKSRSYENGSRYYPSPDTFLYFVSKLLKFPRLKPRLETLLISNLRRRIGTSDLPIELALRVIVAKRLDINNDLEKRKLIKLQQTDGSWPINAIYKFGSKEIYIGNKALSTALAVNALSDA